MASGFRASTSGSGDGLASKTDPRDGEFASVGSDDDDGGLHSDPVVADVWTEVVSKKNKKTLGTKAKGKSVRFKDAAGYKGGDGRLRSKAVSVPADKGSDVAPAQARMLFDRRSRVSQASSSSQADGGRRLRGRGQHRPHPDAGRRPPPVSHVGPVGADKVFGNLPHRAPPSALRSAYGQPVPYSVICSPSPSVPANRGLDFTAPTLADGVRRVTLSQPELDEGTSCWAHTLVGYVVGCRPFFGLLRRWVTRSWQSAGSVQIFSRENGHFFFKFGSAEALETVLGGGPWLIDGSMLILRRWPPSIGLERDLLSALPVWIRFPLLPVHLWTRVIVGKLASAIGIPLFADAATASRSRLSYARCLVEVEATSLFPTEVLVDMPDGSSLTVEVEYEKLPPLCSHCRSFGHSIAHCASPSRMPPRPPEDLLKQPSPKGPSEPPQFSAPAGLSAGLSGLASGPSVSPCLTAPQANGGDASRKEEGEKEVGEIVVGDTTSDRVGPIAAPVTASPTSGVGPISPSPTSGVDGLPSAGDTLGTAGCAPASHPTLCCAWPPCIRAVGGVDSDVVACAHAVPVPRAAIRSFDDFSPHVSDGETDIDDCGWKDACERAISTFQPPGPSKAVDRAEICTLISSPCRRSLRILKKKSWKPP